MKHYLYRLLAPRPTFMGDMDEEERGVMQSHAGYLGARMAEGKVLAFGPVADPAGPYGIALLRLADDEDPRPLVEADPALLSGRGFGYELQPMPFLSVTGE